MLPHIVYEIFHSYLLVVALLEQGGAHTLLVLLLVWIEVGFENNKGNEI